MARTSFEFAALGAIALLVGLLAVAPSAGQSARRLLTRANQLAGRER